jgi:hypothetical protein
VHKEQLHEATQSGAEGASILTDPQWQLPATVEALLILPPSLWLGSPAPGFQTGFDGGDKPCCITVLTQ